MLFKFTAGILGRSGAMISDAVHTLTDLGTTVIAMAGVKIASKDSDEAHPYGHEKFESLAGLLLAFVLFLAAWAIGKAGVSELLAGSSQATVPGLIALAAAAASIITQGVMFWYAFTASKRLDSAALRADSFHHAATRFLPSQRSPASALRASASGLPTRPRAFSYASSSFMPPG
jgi:cation diffusion facilitator family transporter